MKREILTSAVGHVIILGSLLLLSSPLDKPRTYPTIHQVSLVSLPKIQTKSAQTKTIEETKPKVMVQQEKVLPKKTIQKQTPQLEPQPQEAEKKEEETPSQQIEGLGEATFEGGKLESPYYAGIVFAKIKSMWRNPVRTTTLQVTVVFRIQRAGQVTGAEIEVPSGNSLYDQAALRAVLSASPLPALPTHYAGNDLTVHLNFVGVQ
jgi:TonB family protein